MNTRTLVSLDEDDKVWLDAQAAQRAQPMTRRGAACQAMTTLLLLDSVIGFPFAFAPYRVR